MKAKKQLLYLLLAVCSIWIFQSEEASANSESIIVNGTNILQAQDYTVSCGSGTAKYDPITKTLTLNNATISGLNGGNALLYGIDIQQQDVTVELIGQNSIDAYIGISSSSPFRIAGSDGSLAIHASRNQDLNTVPCCGIRIDNGGLTVQNTKLQITVSDLEMLSGYAVYICGGDNKIINSQIEIDMPSSLSSDIQSTGINATGANSLTISDNSSVTMNTVDAGIAVTGNLKVSNSTLAIPSAEKYVISCGNLEIVNGSDLSVSSNSGVALSANEKITISNSTVEVESVGSNSLSCMNLSVTDSSNLTAKGYWPAFYVVKDALIKDSSIETASEADVSIFCKEGNLEIADSDVTCTSGPNYGGILTNGNLTINDSNVISPGSSGVSGIHAKGDILIAGGNTEIGQGNISSENNIQIGGVITSDGTPSYENIQSNNSNGQISFLDANYNAVDKAIEKANALNKNDYINFGIVETAINAVIRGKDIREQESVDKYATAIEDAIKALQPLRTISIIEGADQTVPTGTDKSVTIKADGAFHQFVRLSIDGIEVATEHYTAISGSTIITLKPEYIRTLTVGSHTVILHFTDGRAQTTITIKEENEPENPPEKPEEKPETPDTKPEDPDDKPENPDTKPDNPDDKPENPDTKPDNPDNKPENPDTKPDNPDDKPENPDEKPDNPDTNPDKPENKPGDSSPEQQPQKPDPSANAVQKPTQNLSQNQRNVERAPRTGDHKPFELLIILMAVSVAGLITRKQQQ
ncbi:MAG: hypothetical protein HFH13_13295 [Dorea sp.]|nr:hypothetical protein [Dorea sp.]